MCSGTKGEKWPGRHVRDRMRPCRPWPKLSRSARAIRDGARKGRLGLFRKKGCVVPKKDNPMNIPIAPINLQTITGKNAQQPDSFQPRLKPEKATTARLLEQVSGAPATSKSQHTDRSKQHPGHCSFRLPPIRYDRPKAFLKKNTIDPYVRIRALSSIARK